MVWIVTAIGGLSGGALAAGGSILGGLIGAGGAESAANTQAGAANNATQAQLQMFNQTQANEQPFVAGGQQSFQQLIQGTQPGGQFNTPFNYTQSPGYQFELGQGEQAITNQGAATGAGGGNTMKNLVNYAQGAASTDYTQQLQNWLAQQQQGYNMQSNLAGLGQNAAGNLGNTSAQVGGQIGSNIIGAGNAQAAGTVGATNAISGGLGGAYNAYLQQQMLASLQNQGGGGGAAAGYGSATAPG